MSSKRERVRQGKRERYKTSQWRVFLHSRYVHSYNKISDDIGVVEFIIDSILLSSHRTYSFTFVDSYSEISSWQDQIKLIRKSESYSY